jgi:RNA polymerase sigma-70 factor (ECF subfamily)
VSVDELLDHLFRRQSAQIVATLTRGLGARHLALAEEAVQDALLTAMRQWPFRGVPDDPSAWLFRVARNRALDRLRHERIVDAKAPAIADARPVSVAVEQGEAVLSGEMPPLADDQLAMMFLTCHPDLPRESRVALTLKIVGWFSVAEIARALLVQESAIAQRLVRAKRLLRDRDVEFRPPDAADVAERLDSVLDAIYLLFNEGYAATSGDTLLREDISAEAIRLAAIVARHPIAAAPRAWALLALLLLHAARFGGRVSSTGELFLLRDQDRSKWDRGLISEGLRALDNAAAGNTISSYHLEAEIAACHALAPAWNDTDWKRIVSCYDQLVAITASPVAALNRAVARAQVHGAAQAIADIEQIRHDPALRHYHVLPAVLAELWQETGDASRAAAYYREALKHPLSSPERRFLTTRLQALRAVL